MYKVLSPLGEPIAEAVGAAPRLSDLSGKTICEVWNGQFRGDIAFPMLRQLLQERYPGVKVIPYTEFPKTDVIGSTKLLQERTDTAVALAVQRGCDAIITGMGF
ncbi:MAG: hypothetical protein HYX92_01145 [Chloroflexi bacterium]|nr:hypothetical protein [Chloroflexota bacterium]